MDYTTQKQLKKLHQFSRNIQFALFFSRHVLLGWTARLDRSVCWGNHRKVELALCALTWGRRCRGRVPGREGQEKVRLKSSVRGLGAERRPKPQLDYIKEKDKVTVTFIRSRCDLNCSHSHSSSFRSPSREPRSSSGWYDSSKLISDKNCQSVWYFVCLSASACCEALPQVAADFQIIHSLATDRLADRTIFSCSGFCSLHSQVRWALTGDHAIHSRKFRVWHPS